jgi:hypothetical protein
MQMVAPPRRWGWTAFLYGGITGVVLGVIQVLLLSFVPRAGFWIALLLGLVAPFVVGILVAKRAGKVSAATVSGIWMALGCGIVVIAAMSVLLTIAGASGAWAEALDSMRNSPGLADTDPKQLAGALIGVLVVFAVLYLLGILGGGAGLGALGGLIGRSQSPYARGSFVGGYPASYPPPSVPYPPSSVPYPPPPGPYPPSQPYTEYPPYQGPDEQR